MHDPAKISAARRGVIHARRRVNERFDTLSKLVRNAAHDDETMAEVFRDDVALLLGELNQLDTVWRACFGCGIDRTVDQPAEDVGEVVPERLGQPWRAQLHALHGQIAGFRARVRRFEAELSAAALGKGKVVLP